MNKQQLAAINVDAKVEMSQVVDIFVSRFEEQKIAERDVIQRKLAEAKSKLGALEKAVDSAAVEEVEKKNENVQGLKLTSSIWNGYGRATFDRGHVFVRVEVEWDGTTVGQRTFEVPISQADKDAHKDLVAETNRLGKELTTVMVELRDINRKERQVRAKIAERKLADSDLSFLLEDSELLALVQK